MVNMSSSSDDELNQSSGDEGGQDLEHNVEKAKERVKGLKETVSHLQAFIASANQFNAAKDEEIKRLKATIAELEEKEKENNKPAQNGHGGGAGGGGAGDAAGGVRATGGG